MQLLLCLTRCIDSVYGMTVTRIARLTVLLCVGVVLPLAAQKPDSIQSIDRHITVNGRDRHFRIDLPLHYDSRGPLPVVLDFHGGGGGPDPAREQTGFSTFAAAGEAIVVYPAGSGRFGNNRLLTWNTGTCCGYAQRENIDDVAFVRALLDTLETTYHVDTHRIFATGLSNGGMMTYLVGCRLSDRFAAIAVVSGELTETCTPSRPVSVLIIHGTADENLPYNGGFGQKAIARHDVRPVSYAIDTWLTADRCPRQAVTSKEGVLTHSVWSRCADDTVVELYTIAGGAHTWPGSQRMMRVLDAPSNALDATRVAWAFFIAHPRKGIAGE